MGDFHHLWMESVTWSQASSVSAARATRAWIGCSTRRACWASPNEARLFVAFKPHWLMIDDDCRGLDYPRYWDLSQSMNWDFLLTNQYNGTTLRLLNTAHVPVPFNSCWLLIRVILFILCYTTLYMVFTMFNHNPSCESRQINKKTFQWYQLFLGPPSGPSHLSQEMSAETEKNNWALWEMSRRGLLVHLGDFHIFFCLKSLVSGFK